MYLNASIMYKSSNAMYCQLLGFLLLLLFSINECLRENSKIVITVQTFIIS